MKVHVSDSSCLVDLIRDLVRSGCLLRRVDAATLEVVHPDALTPDEARTELMFFLRAWGLKHPEVDFRLA